MDNIFNITNYDDLPDSIIEDNRLDEQSFIRDKILDVLTQAEGVVTCPMIIAAVWRTHEHVCKRQTMNSTLALMARNGELERPRQGYYRLAQDQGELNV